MTVAAWTGILWQDVHGGVIRDNGPARGASPLEIAHTKDCRMPIATLIVDDDLAFRKAVRQLLERAPEVTVIGEAADGEEGLQLAQALRPDVEIGRASCR